jgi:lipopolysaccharide biosynthesis glycosyltransferase
MEKTKTNTANIQQKLCLATVSSKDYWPGTLVMIKSFLKCNTWFEGEIVIITCNKEYIKKKIEKHRLKVRLIKPSQKLLNKITEIEDEIKYLRNIRLRFLKLELFKHNEYDTIIYYDSDILHLRGIDYYQIINKDFFAAKDPSYLRGYLRHRNTLEKIKISETSIDSYSNYFNSGFLVIGKKFLCKECYEKLILTIDSRLFSKITDSLADEPILNKEFEKEIVIAPIEYNCPIHLLVEGIVTKPVTSIHFTGSYKPWQMLSWLFLLLRSKKYFSHLFEWLIFYLKN